MMNNEEIDKLISVLQEIKTPEPEQNIIDLGMLVGSNVDCEFYDNKNGNWIINSLTKLSSGYHYLKLKDNILPYSKCRVRENHWHYWDGGEYPLPEGLNILIRCKSGEQLRNIKEHRCNWIYDTQYPFPDRDVIGFKVLGSADGWRYEWDLEIKDTNIT